MQSMNLKLLKKCSCLVWEIEDANVLSAQSLRTRPRCESPVFFVQNYSDYGILHEFYLTLDLVSENECNYFCLSQRRMSNKQRYTKGDAFAVLERETPRAVLASSNFRIPGVLWKMKDSDIPRALFDEKWTFTVIFKNKDVFINNRVKRDRTLKTEGNLLHTSLHLTTFSCLENLSEDLSTLLDEGSGSPYDLELKSENRTIKAHKNVLCSRSQVFARMLHSDMTEGQSGVVEIKDMDGDELMYFVKYLYTGTLPDLTIDAAMHLYEAGDKYAVKSLMKRCSCFLIENVASENACTMLLLAYHHNDHDFKEKIIAFIIEEKTPLQDDTWQSFCDMHPRLANEVLNRFLSSSLVGECSTSKRAKFSN